MVPSSTLVENTVQQIIDLLQARKHRITAVRKAIITIIVQERHVTLARLVNLLTIKTKSEVNLMSVYNTLDLLTAEHIIHTNTFDGKKISYELSAELALHFVCDHCHRVEHFLGFNQEQISPIADPVTNAVLESSTFKPNTLLHQSTLNRIADHLNFQAQHYLIEVHGLCSRCQQELKPKS